MSPLFFNQKKTKGGITEGNYYGKKTIPFNSMLSFYFNKYYQAYLKTSKEKLI